MKNIYFITALLFIIASCAPVLRDEYLKQGSNDVNLSEVKKYPMRNKGKLYILGGIIVNTRVTQEGSLIEALFVPVDAKGYLRTLTASGGRFLALRRGEELLDPMIFRKEREITIAGEFLGTQKGSIGDMEYDYPLFEIKEIYLWAEKREEDYYYGYPPYYPYYSPYYPPYYSPWRYRHRYWRHDPRWYY